METVNDFLCRVAATNGHKCRSWAINTLNELFAHDRTMVYSFDYFDKSVQMHTVRLQVADCPYVWGTVISDISDPSCNGDEVGYPLQQITNLKHH